MYAKSSLGLSWKLARREEVGIGGNSTKEMCEGIRAMYQSNVKEKELTSRRFHMMIREIEVILGQLAQHSQRISQDACSSSAMAHTSEIVHCGAVT